MAEILPALAQRVTVLGSTRKSVATSDGVRRAPDVLGSWPGDRGVRGMVMAVRLLSFGGPADRRGSRGCASPARAGFAVVADRDIIGRRWTFLRQPRGRLGRTGRSVSARRRRDGVGAASHGERTRSVQNGPESAIRPEPGSSISVKTVLTWR